VSYKIVILVQHTRQCAIRVSKDKEDGVTVFDSFSEAKSRLLERLGDEIDYLEQESARVRLLTKEDCREE
jgi:hypothetical protein